MTASFSLLALVAVFALALFLGSLNLLIWRVQRLDRTPLWLAGWLAASAVFAFFRILQYAQLSEAAYIVIPRILLTASYTLAWVGYTIGNSYIGFRPPRWERNLINLLVVGGILLLWASNLIFTNQVVIRTIPYGGTPHGTASGPLFLPVNLLMLGLALLPALRLFRSSVPSRRENLLMALGFLFVVLFNLNDIITVALNAHWVRLSDFSYLPVAIFFSYIQGQRFGLLYRDISDMVDERTAELSEANATLRASEHKFSTAFRTSPDSININRLSDGLYVEINDGFTAMTGYTAQEVKGKTSLDLDIWVDPADRAQLVKGLHEQGEVANLEASFRGKDGRVKVCLMSARIMQIGGETCILSITRDISDIKQAQEEIRRHAEEMTVLYETTHDLLIEKDLSKLLRTIVERAAELLNASGGGLYLCEPEQHLVRCVVSYNTPRDYTDTVLKYGEGAAGIVAETGEPLIIDDYRAWLGRAATYEQEQPFVSVLSVPMRWQEQVIGVIHILDNVKAKAFSDEGLRLLTLFANQAAIAVANARLFSDLQDVLSVQSKLFGATTSITSQLDLGIILQNIVQIVRDATGADQANVMLVDERGYCYNWLGLGYENDLPPHFVRPDGISMRVMRSGAARFMPDLRNSPGANNQMIEEGLQSASCLPLRGKSGAFGVMWANFRTAHSFSPKDQEALEIFASQAAIAIENAHLFEFEQRRRQEAAAIAEVGRDISASLQLDIVLKRIATHAKDLLSVETSAVYISDPARSILRAIAALGPDAEEILQDPLIIGEGILGDIALHKLGEIVNDNANDVRAITIKGTEDISVEHLMGVPVLSKGELTGLIAVWRVGEGNEFKTTELDFLSNLAQQAAIAIENASLYEDTRRRLAELEIIQTIASTLRIAQTLDEVFPIILDQLIMLLDFGSALVDLVDPDSGEIVSVLAHGVWAPMTGCRTPANVGGSSQVIATGQPYITTDVVADGLVARPELIGGLNTTACVPIVAQHQPIGTLWVGRRSRKAITNEEINLLVALGEMVGNTIQRMKLHEQTVHQAEEIALAYDLTLEGWAKALELRDKETEGHSRRVSELTLHIARQFKVSEQELTHIRRGILLHDIGKMGVPDHILKKAGPLNDGEWEEMRRHPQYAYDLIHPIDYLRPALDIPYCHHERWDGSGYPRGLKEEQIPLAARIFAVVDVYDALSCDRPYRTAWSRQDVLSYLRGQSGMHFDPKVVEAFFISPFEETIQLAAPS